jgi:hypothetical protein
MSVEEKQARVKADIAALRPLDHGDMGCFEQRHAHVGKYATIMIDGVHYSVPDNLVNQDVAVKMYSERIVVLAGERNRDKVATHTRSRHSGDWKIDLMHYLGTFMRKPAALGHSVALQQVHPKIAALYKAHFTDCPRGFVELLVFTRDKGRSFFDIIAAASRLENRGLKRLSAEQIQAEIISCGEPSSNDADPHASVVDTQQNAIESSALHTLDVLSSLMDPSATSTNLPRA